MADDRSIRIRLLAEIGSYQQGLKRAAQSTSEFGREVSGMGKATSADIERVGRSALLMAAGMGAGLALSAKAAIDWESAWAGVTKTVDGTAEQMGALEEGLRGMARELPATHGEIAGVAEAAGQLGIAVTDVEDFTKVMIDLGETTNLTADQAATSLARVSNIMGTAGADIERMGSTIVELGNNSATTEAEIVELGTRLAAAGKIAGLSEADVFAFASTLTSVGVEAEAGGTALSKVFTSIRDAVIDGNDNLEVFAETAGMTVEGFSSAFREDAAGAIALFVEGLGRMNESGRSTSAVFEELELTDQRLMRALLSTATAGDLLTEQIDMANLAWEENTALQTEAEQRYQTTAAQMEMLRNKVTDLAIDAGQVLLPAINGIVGGLGDMADGFASLPGPVTAVGVGFGAVATAGLGVVGTLGVLGPKVVAAKDALEGMGAAGQFVSRNMGRMALGLGVAGVALAGISYIAGRQARSAAEAEARVQAWAEAIRDAGDAARGSAVYLEGFLAENDELTSVLQGAGVTLDELSEALAAGGEEWDALKNRILESAAASGIAGLKMSVLEGRLDAMASEGKKAETRAETLNDVLGETGPAAEDGAAGIDEIGGAAIESEEELKALQERLEELGDAFGEFTDATTAYEDVLTREQEKARAAAEERAEAENAAIDERVEAIRRSADETAENLQREAQDHIEAAGLTGQAAMDVRRAAADKAAAVRESADAEAEALGEGKANWEDYVGDVKVSVADYIAELEAQVAAQVEWKTNIALIALQGREDVARILAEMGPEGAQQAQLFTEMTGEEFQRAADLFVQTMTDGGEEAGLALETQLGIAAAIGRAGAKTTAEEIAREFDVGLETVLFIAQGYGIDLARELNGMLGLIDELDRRLGASIANASIVAREHARTMDELGIPPRVSSGRGGGIPEATGGLIPDYLAAGGFPGRARGTDTVPVWATPGEFMMSKAAVDRFGAETFAAMNRGSSPAGTVVHDYRTTNFSSTVIADRAPGEVQSVRELRKLALSVD